MKKKVLNIVKRLTILCLTLIMAIASVEVMAFAQVTEGDIEDYISVNPLYQNSLTDNELEIMLEEDLFASNTNDVTYNQNEDALPTITDAAIFVRDNMIARNETFTVEFESNSLDFSGLVAEIFDLAVSEDLADSTVAGDYLAWQYGGYNCSGSRMVTDNNTYLYMVNLTVSYYTTANEEQAVTEAIADVLDEMNIDNLNQYEKVKKIYDFVCDVCDYDDLTNNSFKKFSAYGAIKEHSAVCQGYSVLLYRMCKEAGIDARIIAGNNHSWNIIKLDDAYFNADATWDDDYYDEGLPYLYFLNCEAHFPRHTRLAKYKTRDFNNQYKMTDECYYDIHPELMPDDDIAVYDLKNEKPADELTVCRTHKAKLIKTVAATCTKAGYRTYVCTDCGAQTTNTIPATGHTVVNDKAVAATYAKAGKTAGTHCATCKVVLTAQKTVPKLTVKVTKLNTITAKSKGFTVKWNKQTAATGYEIQYSTDKNFKKDVKTVTIKKNATVTTTVTKLKAKKKYYVRVRCYKTENGKKYYSNWSAVKNITTKK